MMTQQIKYAQHTQYILACQLLILSNYLFYSCMFLYHYNNVNYSSDHTHIASAVQYGCSTDRINEGVAIAVIKIIY